MARYLVDIYIKYKDHSGSIHEEIIEIKPSSQIKKPTKGKKSARNYNEAMMTWAVNSAKWSAAAEYAKKRKMTFRLMTENAIFKG